MWCRGKHGELSNIYDFIFCGFGVLVLCNPFFFVSISLMIFMRNYALTHISFPLRILFFAVGMFWIGRLFNRKPDKLLLRTLYRIRLTAHVIFKVRKEDTVNDVLFAPSSNYREGAIKLTGISIKKKSHDNADSENAVLAHLNP